MTRKMFVSDVVVVVVEGLLCWCCLWCVRWLSAVSDDYIFKYENSKGVLPVVSFNFS